MGAEEEEEGDILPLISGPQWLRTRAKNISRTCASCEAESGSGLRDGIGSRSGSPLVGGWRAMAAMYDCRARNPLRICVGSSTRNRAWSTAEGRDGCLGMG